MADEVEQDSDEYPDYVVTPENRERWDNAASAAEELFGDQGAAQVWSATRAIYANPTF